MGSKYFMIGVWRMGKQHWAGRKSSRVAKHGWLGRCATWTTLQGFRLPTIIISNIMINICFSTLTIYLATYLSNILAAASRFDWESRFLQKNQVYRFLDFLCRSRTADWADQIPLIVYVTSPIFFLQFALAFAMLAHSHTRFAFQWPSI